MLTSDVFENVAYTCRRIDPAVKKQTYQAINLTDIVIFIKDHAKSENYQY